MSRTRTELIDDLFTATFDKSINTIRDQIFDPKQYAFWSLLRQKGGLMPQSGGRQIEADLEVGENEQIFCLSKGGTVDLQDFDVYTKVYYDWSYFDKPIVRYWHDDQKIRNKFQAHNMIQSKINITNKSYKTDIEGRLFGDNVATTKDIQGLQHLVADDPTASRSVGEIDQATYDWWRNVTVDFDDYKATGSGDTGTVEDTDWLASGTQIMRKVIQDCEAETDIIVTSQHMFNLMQDDLLSYFSWDGRLAADLGLPTNTPMFDGVPVIWSKSCGNRMYFLNLDELKFVYDPEDFVSLGEWMYIPNQPKDRVAHVTMVGSFICTHRKSQGVIFGLPAAS